MKATDMFLKQFPKEQLEVSFRKMAIGEDADTENKERGIQAINLLAILNFIPLRPRQGHIESFQEQHSARLP
jgi:hypothetical protein